MKSHLYKRDGEWWCIATERYANVPTVLMHGDRMDVWWQALMHRHRIRVVDGLPVAVRIGSRTTTNSSAWRLSSA